VGDASARPRCRGTGLSRSVLASALGKARGRPNKAMKLTSALAERADLLGVAWWRSARGRQEAPRRSQLIAGVRQAQ
jgi:hypothetical protein